MTIYDLLRISRAHYILLLSRLSLPVSINFFCFHLLCLSLFWRLVFLDSYHSLSILLCLLRSSARPSAMPHLIETTSALPSSLLLVSHAYSLLDRSVKPFAVRCSVVGSVHSRRWKKDASQSGSRRAYNFVRVIIFLFIVLCCGVHAPRPFGCSVRPSLFSSSVRSGCPCSSYLGKRFWVHVRDPNTLI